MLPDKSEMPAAIHLMDAGEVLLHLQECHHLGVHPTGPSPPKKNLEVPTLRLVQLPVSSAPHQQGQLLLAPLPVSSTPHKQGRLQQGRAIAMATKDQARLRAAVHGVGGGVPAGAGVGRGAASVEGKAGTASRGTAGMGEEW